MTANRILIFLLATTVGSLAQLPDALDVTSSLGLQDADGSVLVGNNPHLTSGQVPGCLVQLIDVGPNGKIDLPAEDGLPGGDDILLKEAFVGEGMLPVFNQSGRFTFSVIPRPAVGTRVYLRVFNSPDASTADNWGQSAVHTVGADGILDSGALGLHRTSIPVQADSISEDTDGDGNSNLAELIANTNARDSGEAFSVPGLGRDGTLLLSGSAGRKYSLRRAFDLLEPQWEVVDQSGVLAVDKPVSLRDADPSATRAYYQLIVEFPDLN